MNETQTLPSPGKSKLVNRGDWDCKLYNLPELLWLKGQRQLLATSCSGQLSCPTSLPGWASIAQRGTPEAAGSAPVLKQHPHPRRCACAVSPGSSDAFWSAHSKEEIRRHSPHCLAPLHPQLHSRAASLFTELCLPPHLHPQAPRMTAQPADCS